MPAKRDVAVILAAAGKSRRFSDENAGPTLKKTYAMLGGKPVWVHGAERFCRRDDVRQVIVVVSPDDIAWFRHLYVEEINRMLLLVVPGGEERADSVQNALKAVEPDIEFVAIHDAARPCVTEERIDAVFEKARRDGAALLASPVFGTVKLVDGEKVEKTVSRDRLWEAQTPQVFRREILVDAFSRWKNAVPTRGPTDDAAVVEAAGYPVYIVPSDRWNIKITTRTDLTLAEKILSPQNDEDRPDLRENVAYDNLDGSPS